MRILVLSFYYAPDLSAGSFRTTALVAALLRQLPSGSSVDVITTAPNRYHSFSAEAPALERTGGLTVRRIALPAHRSGMFDQARAFAAFARGVTRVLPPVRYDLVFATSSRLMTAVVGAWVARRCRAPLYLDIRDIFVDTMREVLAAPIAFLASPFLAALERYALRRARRINLVSAGFTEYFERRYPGRSYSFFTNGIDDEFLDENHAPPATPPERATVVYAGNIGDGQGLHVILPVLARLTHDRLRFRIIGDGGRRAELEKNLRAAAVRNVTVNPPVSRAQLLEEYRAADVLLLHLNDYDAFRRVLPSKIFEYAATGKPVWAGVAGYPARFLKEHVENTAVFAPCDAHDAIRVFEQLSLAWRPRTAFTQRFARRAIADAMAADLVAVANGRP